jgi:hypothetical protein
VGPRTSLDAVARRRIPAPAGTRTLVVQPVAWSLYCLSYHGCSFFLCKLPKWRRHKSTDNRLPARLEPPMSVLIYFKTERSLNHAAARVDENILGDYK